MDIVMVVTCAATAVIAFWVFLLVYRRLPDKKQRGPKAWPFVGSVCELVANVEHLHDWLLKYAEMYTTFTVTTTGRSYIYTVDPSVMEYVFKTNFHNYGKGKQIPALLCDLFGGGLYTADEEDWKWHLKTARYQFVPKVLRDFCFDINKEFALKGAIILANAHVVQGTKEIDLQDIFTRMAFDSTCKIVCGVDTGSLSEGLPHVPFPEAFENAENLSFKRAVDPFWRLKRFLVIGSEAVLKKDLTLVNEFTQKVINSRRVEVAASNTTNPDNVNNYGDMLSRILIICKDDSKIMSTDKHLRDMILNTLEGGRCTIANALSWTFYMICVHPLVQENILQELLQTSEKDRLISEAICGSINEKVEAYVKALDFETLNKMQYLQAAITETLRLYPAVPIDSREAVADDLLPDGTRVKKGDLVGSVPYSMGRMKVLWGSDAKEFKPERWLKDNVFVPESPFKFATFGAGPRSCVGKDAAYLQIKIAVAVLVKFFKFRMVAGHRVKYRVAPSLPMSEEGLLVRFEPR
ncbi:hypothetical protein O6H91_12G056200 [Diphasiastrum complanatum]|uniref:Uncharacterized protein n=3 Tax=Diphasiastrum complanatum TaxID=34168 RepID=A0ACC2C2A2_DIPCM|nr:hypothetical protein O6H91_12G056200 [Diphasiastrum complanatum]KAJ7536089.1 hypothetical protein O6H91_12G056200 [Diphasiastrum complanatum]KAJ7536090.1 hypothetical protein O6H91_12G056200 [Diphasiastrum complanatum]